MFKLTPLRITFLFELLMFALIVTGAVPREVSLGLAAILAGYALLARLEDAVVLFVVSIPLFLALPITPAFDNFNTWRIVSAIIFIRWLVENFQFSIFNFQKIPKSQFFKNHPHITGLLLLTVLAFLSLIGSPDWKLGLKRIIYFGNLSLVGIVIWDLGRKRRMFIERVIRAVTVPTMLVILVGFIQVASTYLIDIYQFMRIWGEGIQLRQFGAVWSEIAVRLGNTWFAYYGEQLSLRVFSLFPDSHSFPQFVLLGIPALFAVALDRLVVSDRFKTLATAIRTRTRLKVVWIPLGLLMAILSGTRGIWAASVGVVILAGGIFLWMRRRAGAFPVRLFSYIALYLALFFMLFAVAYPIFVSPQFLVSKGDFLLLGERIRSIIDFGETSNAQRILIWKASLASIAKHPLLGVGIGNFPVVLGQDLFLARAGSSAHNIYLHIAAEMGIPALMASLWLLWALFAKTYRAFLSEIRPVPKVYYTAALLYVPWVLAYSLTDVALFDERAFLLFVTTIALIASHE